MTVELLTTSEPALGLTRLPNESELSLLQRTAFSEVTSVGAARNCFRWNSEGVRKIRLPAHPKTLARLALAPFNWSADLAVDYVRQCPICMEAGYHTPLFQLRMMVLCPVHGVDLLESCVICSAPLEGYECPRCHGMACGADVVLNLDDVERRAIDTSMTRARERIEAPVDYVSSWLPKSKPARERLERSRRDLLAELSERAASHFWQGTHHVFPSYLRSPSRDRVVAIEIKRAQTQHTSRFFSASKSIREYAATVKDVAAAVPRNVIEQVDSIICSGAIDRQYWLAPVKVTRDALAIVLWRMALEGVSSSRHLREVSIRDSEPESMPLVTFLASIAFGYRRRYLLVLLCSISECIENLARSGPVPFEELFTIAMPGREEARGGHRFLVREDQIEGIQGLLSAAPKQTHFNPAGAGQNASWLLRMRELWTANPRAGLRAMLDGPEAFSTSAAKAPRERYAVQKTYGALFGQFLRYLGSISVPLLNASPQDIEAFLASMRGKGGHGAASPMTIHRLIALLRRVFRQLCLLELLVESPVEVVLKRKHFARASAITTVLSLDEYERLAQYICALPRGNFLQHRRAALLAVAAGGGVVGVELARLSRSQLRTEGGSTWLAMPANGRRPAADILLPKWTSELLASWIAMSSAMGATADLVFPSAPNSNTPLCNQSLHRYAAAALAAIGRDQVTGAMRVFRATLISVRLLEVGFEETKRSLRLKSNKVIYRNLRQQNEAMHPKGH